MTLPTSKPNLTNREMIYPSNLDDNWGESLNQNFKKLGQNIDTYKLSVRDSAKEIELSVATHFETLKDAMNDASAEYILALKTNRQNAMSDLKAVIDLKIESAVTEMVNNTKGQLDEISDIKAILLLGITRIQTEYNLTSGYIEAGIDRMLRVLDNEVETTSSAKEDIVNSVKEIRGNLLEHISNYNNPHDFNTSQIKDSKPVYQPDPLGNDSIFPLAVDDVIEVPSENTQIDESITLPDETPKETLDLTTAPLLYFSLGDHYLILENVLDTAETFDYRFGPLSPAGSLALSVREVIFQSLSSGIYEVVAPSPIQTTITYSETDILRGEGHFDIIVFSSDTPVEGGQVTISIYPKDRPLANPDRVITANIIRLNQTNKPTLLNNIILFSAETGVTDPDNDEVVADSGLLKMEITSSDYSITTGSGFDIVETPALFHWTVDTLINPGVILNVAQIYKSSVELTEEEVLFDVPLAYRKIVGENWSDIEAANFNAADSRGAAYYDSASDSLVLFFEPDENNLSHEYTIKFVDNTDPIQSGTFVNVIWKKWDTEAALSDVNNYTPELIATGVAEIFI